MQHDLPASGTQVLRGLELFSGLPEVALAEILADAQIYELDKDTVVFRQGECAEHCYALITGRVRISQSDEEGEQLLVRFISAGEMFGTVALFTGGNYPAEGTTTLKSVIARWPEASLLRLIERHPRIALNILKVTGARLREMQERLREVATQRAHRRIARVLLRLHAQAGQSTGSGEISFPLTRQDIAAMCGTTLHTASRVLTDWEKRGLLTTHRSHVVLRRLKDIQSIADEPGI
ncbi:MAG: Crp/Fnr family transcriptional regulator [Proteobacteria bacterium]|nr:Crp/Fnr family transcriptional regulator [Pseudomonadota bacterium]